MTCKEKINTSTKGNEMKKVPVQQKKKCQPKVKRKTQEQRSSNQKYLSCQAKRCPGIKLICFCTEVISNLNPHLSAITLNLNLTHKITRAVATC